MSRSAPHNKTPLVKSQQRYLPYLPPLPVTRCNYLTSTQRYSLQFEIFGEECENKPSDQM